MKTLKNGFSNVRTSIHTFVILIITLIFSLNVPAQQQLKNLPIPEVKQLSGVPILDTRPFTLPGTDHVVEEYIVKGKATSYKAVGELPSDGFWNVEEADTASYTTRYVVIRPVTADKFNGSVIVEWINVTGGFDFSPSRIMMWRELARNGSVWIGVSAQKVGVEGGLTLSGMSTPLKKMNPERYAQLHHPGDAFSYDIYTQAGRFLKGPNGSKVLGGLSPKHVIAMGQSQSAFYMTTYINAVHPIVQVYDGFLNYSRFAFAAPLSGADITSRWVFTKDKVKMRTDLKVPMLIFETETDIVGSSGMMAFLGYSAARQPDTDMIRVWEVPGTAHSDTYLYGGSRVDTGTASYETLATAWAPSTNQPGMQLKSPINNAPQHHYVVQAAISALEKWVAKGNPPAHATPIWEVWASGYTLFYG